ncbi:MAG: hypothetical protein KF796_20615 [Ramlibacter sp.]|nr:hypothetical protein [Ramlibacter sp.]
MTNDHIQSVLAMSGALYKDDVRGMVWYVNESACLLAQIAKSGGAISIADEASWELIQSECRGRELNGVNWYEVHATNLRLDLNGEDEEIFQRVSEAVSYLTSRGLLVAHPDNATLVRQRDPASPEVRT